MNTATNTRTGISLDHCTRVYGEDHLAVTALRDVSLHVAPGEFVAVMGPSGSGKSTVLNLMSGLDDPTTGTVAIGTRVMQSLSSRDRAQLRRTEIGIVFQRLNLVPQLNGIENVMLPLELEGLSARAARPAAAAALAQVGAAHLDERFPDVLSGGEQQRVAIARALVGDRRVILADEPTASLDSLDGEAIVRLLRGLADNGVTVVMVSHDPRWAAWADRIVTLHDGSITDETRVEASEIIGVSR